MVTQARTLGIRLRGAGRTERTRALLRRHRMSIAVLSALLLSAGFVHASMMYENPSTAITDDEGTYVAQAWAIVKQGSLAHYTYWYDHPPLGWMQIAFWAWLTDGFDRLDAAVAVGREAMLVAKLASVGLMFGLARRLGFNRGFAAIAVMLFAVNPLGVFFQRLTFLDNIAIPWLLAAFFLAASPRCRLAAHVGSAFCFVVAALTKETVAIMLPALVYQLAMHRDTRTRRYSSALFYTAIFLGCLSYPLYALIKGELLPGPGHVDLLYAVKWQLLDRAGSGSVFDTTSTASAIVRSWINLDSWLLGLSIVSIPIAAWSRRLRPVVLAYVIQLAMMVRGGYLPQPYVIAMLPFAALVLAGSADALWQYQGLTRFPRLARPHRLMTLSHAQLLVRVPAAVAVAAVFWYVAVPEWRPGVASLMTVDRNESVHETREWIDEHVPRDSTVLVGDAMWVDLVEAGYDSDRVIWYFKADQDPEVQARLPRGWRDVDYVVFTHEMSEIAKSSDANIATTLAARENGTLVAEFGSQSEAIWVYSVNT